METTELCCHICNTSFLRPRFQQERDQRRNQKFNFCSDECKYKHQSVAEVFACRYCSKAVYKRPCDLRKAKNVFCNSSCAASFNNTLKRKSRRSKCEKLLFKLLSEEFSQLKILHNDKTMLDGLEADIAIPELKIAIEWNGIVHFKPIYGQPKLDKIQQKDAEKQNIASKKNISLIVVPDLVSTESKVKEAFVEISKILRSRIKG